jgi:hypothetical protein
MSLKRDPLRSNENGSVKENGSMYTRADMRENVKNEPEAGASRYSYPQVSPGVLERLFCNSNIWYLIFVVLSHLGAEYF